MEGGIGSRSAVRPLHQSHDLPGDNVWLISMALPNAPGRSGGAGERNGPPSRVWDALAVTYRAPLREPFTDAAVATSPDAVT